MSLEILNQRSQLKKIKMSEENKEENKISIGKEIFKASYLKGSFKLRSGKISNEYFDKYRFESQPHLLEKVAKTLSDLVPKDTDFLAGLEMGGIPICVALSHQLNRPSLFVRKRPKEYGSLKIAEGLDFKNKRVCIIEDVITTGGQVIESVRKLREEKALITHVLCVILRGEEKKVKQSMKSLNLELRFLFHMEQLKSLK